MQRGSWSEDELILELAPHDNTVAVAKYRRALYQNTRHYSFFVEGSMMKTFIEGEDEEFDPLYWEASNHVVFTGMSRFRPDAEDIALERARRADLHQKKHYFVLGQDGKLRVVVKGDYDYKEF